MPTHTCGPRAGSRIAVFEQDQHRRAFWATQEECLQLTRLGLARSFGTKNRVHGFRLQVATRVAASRLWENGHLDRRPAGGLRTVVRELVGGGHHVWSHRSGCAPRSEAIGRVLARTA